ncbi:DUF1127 domain-containing protein [Agrobacterium sp. fls2-241-TYG-188a]|uniref:DUF1127 domain-containing protein n=1 Tax=Agrobacterium sp. fls2-241-TYG-188a TaxID=3040275 RepID=UPI000DD95E59|nr:DUF1127 domain-containing protein [Agrobacterium sp. fls2-241-TYG-188a]
MSNDQLVRVNSLSAAVDELLKQFGLRSTLRAVFFAALRKKRVQMDVLHLSDRMRKDIGLPVKEPVSKMPPLPLWLPRF